MLKRLVACTVGSSTESGQSDAACVPDRLRESPVTTIAVDVADGGAESGGDVAAQADGEMGDESTEASVDAGYEPNAAEGGTVADAIAAPPTDNSDCNVHDAAGAGEEMACGFYSASDPSASDEGSAPEQVDVSPNIAQSEDASKVGCGACQAEEPAKGSCDDVPVTGEDVDDVGGVETRLVAKDGSAEAATASEAAVESVPLPIEQDNDGLEPQPQTDAVDSSDRRGSEPVIDSNDQLEELGGTQAMITGGAIEAVSTSTPSEPVEDKPIASPNSVSGSKAEPAELQSGPLESAGAKEYPMESATVSVNESGKEATLANVAESPADSAASSVEFIDEKDPVVQVDTTRDVFTSAPSAVPDTQDVAEAYSPEVTVCEAAVSSDCAASPAGVVDEQEHAVRVDAAQNASVPTQPAVPDTQDDDLRHVHVVAGNMAGDDDAVDESAAGGTGGSCELAAAQEELMQKLAELQTLSARVRQLEAADACSVAPTVNAGEHVEVSVQSDPPMEASTVPVDAAPPDAAVHESAELSRAQDEHVVQSGDNCVTGGVGVGAVVPIDRPVSLVHSLCRVYNVGLGDISSEAALLKVLSERRPVATVGRV